MTQGKSQSQITALFLIQSLLGHHKWCPYFLGHHKWCPYFFGHHKWCPYLLVGIVLLFAFPLIAQVEAETDDSPVFTEIPVSLAKPDNPDTASRFTVRNLKVEDIPEDDGSGLQITWDALPTSAKIISYRIYRGTSQDSLFFIGDLSVNTTDVATTKTFIDKSWTPFVDVSSPGRLRLEKVQPPGKKTLYKDMPRDVSIIGPMLKNYTLLSIIPKDYYYFKTKMVEKYTYPSADADDTEEEDADQPADAKKTFAGLKLNQISIYKQLKADHEYYYTVVAVNQLRKFHPPAEPVMGIPIDNKAETPPPVYAVYLKDKGYLQFSWDLPKSDDVLAYSLYAVEDEAQYNNWLENKVGEPPATLIWQEYLINNWTESLKNNNLRIITAKENDTTLLLSDSTPADTLHTIKGAVEDLKFYLVHIDFSGKPENFSDNGPLSPLAVKDSSMIPPIDDVTVIDRKNDKGDYMSLYWGKPFAHITAVSLLSERRGNTRLNIAYDYSSNPKNKIKNIYFEIYNENGVLLKKVNEFYFDKVFRITIPTEYAQQKLDVKISFKTKQGGLDLSHYLTQELVFDHSIMILRPQGLYYEGFCVDDFKFTLLRRQKSSQTLRMSNTLSFVASRSFGYFDRESIDMVSYISTISKQITDYDKDKNLMLASHTTDLVFDTNTKRMVNTSIYRSVSLADVAKMAPEDTLNARLKYINTYPTDKARMKALKRIRETDRREYAYRMMVSDGKGLFEYKDITIGSNGEPYFVSPISNWFNTDMLAALLASLIFGSFVVVFVRLAKQGNSLYIRPIAGIEEIDNAIGRATEMGRPILYCPGLSSISDVATLAGLSILSRVAKKAAEYDTRILVPNRDNVVLSIAQEIVREAHSEAGRPDSFDRNNVFFVSENQFAYVAGVNGTMIREKTATNFYMGMFWAESLIMTEAGNQTGAIQIAGTDAVTQIPFFITTCDYTLIGEELYAASAYMNPQPLMIGTLKAQDYTKFLMLVCIVVGTIFSTLHITAIIDLFPSK